MLVIASFLRVDYMAIAIQREVAKRIRTGISQLSGECRRVKKIKMFFEIRINNESFLFQKAGEFLK